MKLLYDNKILTATINTNSEDDNYPLVNVQNGVRAKKYRSVTNTGVWILISTPITATYLIIDQHNLSASADVYLQGNDTNVWTNPTTNLTVTPTTSDPIVYNFASKTHNYWRLLIDDADSNGDAYIEIGIIYLGTSLQLPGVKPDQSLKKVTTSKSDISEGGANYGDRRLQYRKFGVNFPNVGWTDRTNMLTAWDNNENVLPLYVLLWSDRQDLEAIAYCVFDLTEIEFKRNPDSTIFPFTTSLSFKEVF